MFLTHGNKFYASDTLNLALFIEVYLFIYLLIYVF
jgi:hypothetical protein